MIWDVLNALFAVGITVFASYKLVLYPDAFKPSERAGLGLMAGSVLMTIPPLLSAAPTPFDDWSPAVLRIGVFLYLAGKVLRLIRHNRANDAQLAQAQEWMGRKG